MGDSINNTVMTDDIFMKAAVEYCRRMNIDPNGVDFGFQSHASTYRNELACLAEKILSLKTVGAI